MTKMPIIVKMKADFFKINKKGELVKTIAENKRKINQNQTGKKTFFTKDIGFTVVFLILFFVFMGLMIDERLSTKPVFTITMVFIGIIASFYHLLKQAD